MKIINVLVRVFIIFFFSLFYSQSLSGFQVLFAESKTDKLLKSSDHIWINNHVDSLIGKISSITDLKINYSFYNDSLSPNIKAQPSKDKNYDGELLIGRNLATHLFPERSVLDIKLLSYMIYHEVGHVIQYSLTRPDVNYSQKQKELEADFIAGALFNITPNVQIKTIHNLELLSGGNDAVHLDDAFKEFTLIDILARRFGDMNSANPFSHGTPELRKLALKYGKSYDGLELFFYEAKKILPTINLWNLLHESEVFVKNIIEYSNQHSSLALAHSLSGELLNWKIEFYNRRNEFFNNLLLAPNLSILQKYLISKSKFELDYFFSYWEMALIDYEQLLEAQNELEQLRLSQIHLEPINNKNMMLGVIKLLSGDYSSSRNIFQNQCIAGMYLACEISERFNEFVEAIRLNNQLNGDKFLLMDSSQRIIFLDSVVSDIGDAHKSKIYYKMAEISASLNNPRLGVDMCMNALKYFHQSLFKSEINLGQIYYLLAISYRANNDLVRGFDYLKKACKIGYWEDCSQITKIESKKLEVARFNSLLRTGSRADFEKEITILSNLFESGVDAREELDIFERRSLLFKGLGDDDGAIKDLNSAINRAIVIQAESVPLLRYRLGVLLYQTRRLEDASKEFEISCKQNHKPACEFIKNYIQGKNNN